MCTAISLKQDDLYFGRTLDNEFSYLEEVTVIPRNYGFNFRNGEVLKNHYAIIGMAYNKDGFPFVMMLLTKKVFVWRGLISLEMSTTENPKKIRLMWHSLN